MRIRTSSPRVFAFSPAEMGRNLSTWARRRPFLPMTGISDLSLTLPGIPMMPVLGGGGRLAAGIARNRRSWG